MNIQAIDFKGPSGSCDEKSLKQSEAIFGSAEQLLFEEHIEMNEVGCLERLNRRSADTV